VLLHPEGIGIALCLVVKNSLMSSSYIVGFAEVAEMALQVEELVALG